jgi:mycothiol S-conjugate amidase
MRAAIDVLAASGERPWQDDRITTRIEVGQWLSVRRDALLAHATQIDPTSPFWFGLSDEVLAELYPWEEWVLARSLVGTPTDGELEHDLFAGVRSEARESA